MFVAFKYSFETTDNNGIIWVIILSKGGIMRKIILFTCLLLLIFTLVACIQGGDTKNVSTNIGESNKFSEVEISDAISSVKEKFKKDFQGCTLTDLWYDEEFSNRFVEGYLKGGRGSLNNVKRENVIVLSSNFDVDSSGGDGSLEPNSTYTSWSWVLIRDSKTDKWRVDDWGY